MKFGQASARVLMPPASFASTATAQFTFDTSGFDEAVVDVEFGTNTTTNGKPALFSWLESDDTVVTNFAAITALTGGTNSGNFTIPAQSALGVGGLVQFQIDLRARKRYLQLQMTPGTSGAQVLSVNAQLHRAEQLPVSAAQKSIINRDLTTSTAIALIVQA